MQDNEPTWTKELIQSQVAETYLIELYDRLSKYKGILTLTRPLRGDVSLHATSKDACELFDAVIKVDNNGGCTIRFYGFDYPVFGTVSQAVTCVLIYFSSKGKTYY